MEQIKYVLIASLQALIVFILLVFINKIISTDSTNSNVVVTTKEVKENKPALSAIAAAGKTIFQQNCQSCHALNKNLTGPALAGLTERGPWTDRKNLYAWVYNPAAFMQKDAYTQGLKAQYGSIMPGFPQLSEKDIDAIVEYVNAEAS